MLDITLTHDELIKLHPFLRKSLYYQIYQDARTACLAAALLGDDYKAVPLYSHNATYQKAFTLGWRSITEQDIRLYKAVSSPNAFTPFSSRDCACR